MKRTALTLCVAALTALGGCAANRESRCACCQSVQQPYSTYPGASQ